MSIQNKIRIVNRIENLALEIKAKYQRHDPALHELNKLSEALHHLKEYLSHLDQLKPNYTTNELDKFMKPINLNIVILKGELDKSDYNQLNKSIKLLTAVLKFHPTKYSFFEFAIIWFYELIYFI